MRLTTPFMLIAVLLTLSGCTYNPATQRKQLLSLSPDQEITLGTEAMPALVEQYGGEIGSAQLRTYLTTVGTKLLAGVEEQYRDLPWQFTLLDSDVINAFALPGGKVFMSRGLMQWFDNEAEVAGVLGHEIGHVTGQHIDERITQQFGLEVVGAIISSATDTAWVNDLAVVFRNGYQLSFGRNQESEADILGVKYMTLAGYDPDGMLDVLDVLAEVSEGNRQPEFLSTHPHPETRIATVSRLLEGEYAYTQGNSAYGKFPARFEEQAGRLLPPPTTSTTAPGALGPRQWCPLCHSGEAE